MLLASVRERVPWLLHVTCFEIWRWDLWLAGLQVTQDVDITHQPTALSPIVTLWSLTSHRLLCSCSPVVITCSCLAQGSLSWSLATLSVFPDCVSRSDCASPLLCSRSALQATWPAAVCPAHSGPGRNSQPAIKLSGRARVSQDSEIFLMVKNILNTHF